MKTTKTKIISYFKNPKLIGTLIAVFWFAIGTYAFTAPPGGCTPGSCDSPLEVDFSAQTVTVETAPTSTGHVTNKEYVDNAIAAAGGGSPYIDWADCEYKGWCGSTTYSCTSGYSLVDHSCTIGPLGSSGASYCYLTGVNTLNNIVWPWETSCSSIKCCNYVTP